MTMMERMEALEEKVAALYQRLESRPVDAATREDAESLGKRCTCTGSCRGESGLGSGEVCSQCNGSGAGTFHPDDRCHVCDGTGEEPLPREDAPPRAKPDCSDCKGTGNTVVGNELTSNVVPCHCVSGAAIAGLCASPFGTPLELIPEGATEFVSDGFRALRLPGYSVRVEGIDVWSQQGAHLYVGWREFTSNDLTNSASHSYNWLRYWLPRADEPISLSLKDARELALKIGAEADEQLADERQAPAKDSLTAEAGEDGGPRKVECADCHRTWEERVKPGTNYIPCPWCLAVKRSAQRAEEIARLKESVKPLTERIHQLENLAERRGSQLADATARAEKAEARVMDLIGERGSEDEP